MYELRICGMQHIFAPGHTWIESAKYTTKILASIVYHNMAVTDHQTKFDTIST